MGDRRGAYRALVGKPETYHLKHLGIGRRITLKWIFKKLDAVWGTWTRLLWLRIGTDDGRM
jgi:hypothetical protein